MNTPAGRDSAVVIGAGIAGLAAAKVLANRFARVLVIDRDELPDKAEPRRGVPQGQHSHVLLVAGQRTLEELFPGLGAELVDAGAVVFDSASDLHLYRLGAVWQPVHSDLPFVSLSRPLLEHTLRERVRKLANVTIRTGTAVSALTGSDGQVSTVVLDGAETVAADLVVDCSGRGSRSNRWLGALGFPPPEAAEVKVNVGYVSRLYRRKPGDLDVCAAFIQPTPPHEKKIGAALLIENDTWLVSVGGWHGDYPKPDEESFLRHAKELPDPIIADLITRSEPLTEPVPYHFSSNRRRFFEQLDDVPGGYVALGDSICSFNPLYGQGMTCAAQQAQALGQVLDAHGEVTADVAKAYYQAAAGITFIPWQAAIGSDFDYPETGGAKPPATELFGRFSTQVQLAAQVSGEVRKHVLSVQHLLAPPMVLWRPSLVAEVVRAARHAPDEHPRFGSGQHGRPLWTEQDQDAELVRAALREAGLAEFTDEQLGFAVEGGEPMLVTCTDPALIGTGGLDRYTEAITAAGFTATTDPDDAYLLRVLPAPGLPRSRQRLASSTRAAQS